MAPSLSPLSLPQQIELSGPQHLKGLPLSRLLMPPRNKSFSPLASMFILRKHCDWLNLDHVLIPNEYPRRAIQSSDWLGTHPSLSPGGQANVNGSPSRTTWSSPEEGGHCDQEKKEKDVGQTKMLHDPTDSEGTEQDP